MLGRAAPAPAAVAASARCDAASSQTTDRLPCRAASRELISLRLRVVCDRQVAMALAADVVLGLAAPDPAAVAASARRDAASSQTMKTPCSMRCVS